MFELVDNCWSFIVVKGYNTTYLDYTRISL